MRKKLVSIVVPVYGIEDYIEKCVSSLLKQTYKSIEIILVDDESPDHCPQICDDYAKKHKQIQVIHKKNGGLSDARNAGLEKAKGEYIAFVDGDDYIAPDFIQTLYDDCIANGSDISCCGFYWTYGERLVEHQKSPTRKPLRTSRRSEIFLPPTVCVK